MSSLYHSLDFGNLEFYVTMGLLLWIILLREGVEDSFGEDLNSILTHPNYLP